MEETFGKRAVKPPPKVIRKGRYNPHQSYFDGEEWEPAEEDPVKPGV